MRSRRARAAVDDDRVLRGMLADAREHRPERARKESIMAAAFRARWGLAIAAAGVSASVAVAALIVIATPWFTEATGPLARVALTGVTPVLAILAVASAARASSRILKVRWGAVALGALGSLATSITVELWYAGVGGAQAAGNALLVAASAAVALNGGALLVLIRPAFRGLPAAGAIALEALILVFGGAAVVLFAFPVMSTVLVAGASALTVLLLHRGEGRTATAGTSRSA